MRIYTNSAQVILENVVDKFLYYMRLLVVETLRTRRSNIRALLTRDGGKIGEMKEREMPRGIGKGRRGRRDGVI